MNDLEYNLLRLIDSGALTSAADLEEQENTACMFLQSQGWIFLSLDDSIQGLTPEGRIALYQESKARESLSKNEVKNRKNQKKQSDEHTAKSDINRKNKLWDYCVKIIISPVLAPLLSAIGNNILDIVRNAIRFLSSFFK